jgi:ABC-type branched-subunit amino acid transport system ATPase component
MMATTAATAPLLEVNGVTRHFGGVVAVDNISFQIDRMSISGLIGPNGSGKTTLINIINGIVPPETGRINLCEESIVGLRPNELAGKGISRTFQSARVFSTLTVLQNLFIPLLHRGKIERTAAEGRARELLTFVGLERHAHRAASELSGGQQRLLEFARALATRPSLVLMDEPFAGVHPETKRLLSDCIKEAVKRDHASFLIVSHEVPDLVRMSDYMLCLVAGKIAAAGPPSIVIKDQLVIEGYLGRA